jgi:hypothetical protein
MSRRTHLGFCAVLIVLPVLLPTGLHAKPAHKKALIEFFGPALPKNLHDCHTCHLPSQPGIDEGAKPHNVFGARLAALRKQFRKDGKNSDLISRLEAIAEEDSDGDGASNYLELLSGHCPGDPKDKPTAAEQTTAHQKLADFRARPREAYAWRPFEPVKRPAVPKVEQVEWQCNPIDAFLAAEHKRQGLQPQPEAPKPILLRRVYLDLIGLPPTAEELHAFLDDHSPHAYEKVVDRLLASPRYGERWGRHWMDVWRYADWAGYGAEVRDSQPHIWHWRDWIIESLNADKGYDRMVQEMLAADELAPGDVNAVRATGFLVRNWYKFNRNVWMERTVEHTAKAFLGITLNCARCHDHFFDPFTQKEFYAFRAIFEPEEIRTERIPGIADVKQDGIPRIYDAKADAPTYLFHRGDERNPDKSKVISPAVPAALGGSFEIKPVALPGAKPAMSTGRRLALARWITDRNNPLAARVAMNHIWLRHFGTGIVPTEFDFGRNGKPPSHPALLDWLAAEFMAHGWSMKYMHRLIVTSRAYRLDSHANPDSLARDRDNRYLWRMNTRRMEAEVVRDSLLYVAGQLDLTMGGPDIDQHHGLTSRRRSLYFRHAAEKQMEFLTLFDAASVTECYRRNVSIVPQQALALANSSLALEQSRLLARSLAQKVGTSDAANFVKAGFEQVLSRPPTAEETAACVQFLREQTALLANGQKLTASIGAPISRVPAAANPAQRARENLIHVLMNHNDFVTIR